jgi:hypothetical protein
MLSALVCDERASSILMPLCGGEGKGLKEITPFPANFAQAAEGPAAAPNWLVGHRRLSRELVTSGNDSNLLRACLISDTSREIVAPRCRYTAGSNSLGRTLDETAEHALLRLIA